MAKKNTHKIRFYDIVSFWEAVFIVFLGALSLIFLWLYLSGYSVLNNKGIKAFRRQEFSQAQLFFQQALAEKPFEYWSYLNLALTHDILKTPEKAFKIYDIVSSAPLKGSILAVFYSYFNKGELSGRLGQIEKALKNYQKALEFNYRKKDIKTNIELLLKNQSQAKKKNSNRKGDKDKSSSSGDSQKKEKDSQQKKEDSQEKERDSQKKGENSQKKERDSQKEKGDSQKKEEDAQEKEQNNPSSLDNRQEKKKSQEGLGEKEPNRQILPTGAQPASSLQELSEKEREAILQEIEAQENKVRYRLYRKNKAPHDENKQDW